MSVLADAVAALTPRPTPRDPVAVEALQRGRMRSALAWLIGGIIGAHFAGMSVMAVLHSAGGSLAWPAAAALACSLAACLSAAWMLAVGGAQLWLLARAQPVRRAEAARIGGAAAIAALLAPMALVLAGPLHALVPLAVVAAGLALLVAGPGVRVGAIRPVRAAALGVVAAAVAVAVGALDALVLLPMTLVPGMPLAELQAGLQAAGEEGGSVLVLWWAGAWAAAIALLAAGLVRSRCEARGSLAALLGAGVLALAALPFVELATGMSVADTFATRGGMSIAYPAIALAATLLAAAASALLTRPGRG